ncbi:MAG: NAD(P)H dehydrogenase (quinone) [Glaciecola sp.]|jgi:NAD(P)H dehydrogenase (quinone)
MKIGLVYFSNTDVTGKLMSALKAELLAGNAIVVDHKISGEEIIKGRFINDDLFKKLHECHAIIFGTPTYMGGVAAQFKAFADATSDFWSNQRWADKIAAGITSGTGLNGDQSSTLHYLTVLASQHGMVWVGLDAPYNNSSEGINRLGCQIGVTACSTDGVVDESDLKSAQYLARRVLKLAGKINQDT